MRRLFIHRYRRDGNGLYVTQGDPITHFLYISQPWEYDAGDPYVRRWTEDVLNAASVFFDPRYYIEVTEDILPLLRTPEYINHNTSYRDRTTLPEIRFTPPSPQRIKTSNTKHKVGVPKNKLP